MSRDEVLEGLTAERYGSQWAAREQARTDERRRLLAGIHEDERVDEEKSA